MDSVAARRLLLSCFQAGVAAVDPEEAVLRNLDDPGGRVVVLALGKAAPAMARGAARALQREKLEGLVVSNHRGEVPAGMDAMIASHPVPDATSVAAGRSLLSLAEGLGEADTAVVLISGGGSALAEVPVPGVTIEAIAATTELLLRSGVDIEAMNTVRRRLSAFKGGRLAAALAPANVLVLAVSDVVGDSPAAIASGPTVNCDDPPGAARAIIEDSGLLDEIPTSVRTALSREPAMLDTPPRHEFEIVASAAVAAHAAAAAAAEEGIGATVLDTRLVGEASQAAGDVLTRSGFGVSVFAGETTVRVTGSGIGGRNQEAALTAATIIEGDPRVWFLAAGTDGIDGLTPAAGAVVDGGTAGRARRAGLDPGLALDTNDSGSFFAELGEQIVTGPTGTNVGDLWLVLRD